MASSKSFRISSALKNIIGKELITNDFIAVFELVKNSFDANATRVDVIFEGLDTENPKLIIKDNGKGMDAQDLEKKWLFVAYSAKKDGTENFRDEIQRRRIHAGAKGIGRFSCDKLGQDLKIYTKRKSDVFNNILSVEWANFELDAKKEFESIPVEYSRAKETPYNLKHGTVLEITSFREQWDREKLLKLKRSLEKLINPNQKNDSDNFKINLIVPSEKAGDKEVGTEKPWLVVNGAINNFLFENLGLKSTYINVRIAKSGQTILTRLEDRGVLIYEIEEKNSLTYGDGKVLNDIEISLFALNQNAKSYFTKYMGVIPRVFGSVLFYKNGFRIHPFGEVGDDSLGLDSRKTQGYSRYLGTRDIIGRIEIGDNPDFQEASSRDGGLVKNAAFDSLTEMFYTFCLKRLERYAVDIVKYGNLSDSFEADLKSQGDIRPKILELIQDLSQSSEIIDIKYDPKIVDILGELSEKSLQNLLKNFERIASETNNPALQTEAKKARVRLAQLNKARLEAEDEAAKEKAARKKAEADAIAEAEKAREAEKAAAQAVQDAETKASENLFLQSIVSKDVVNVLSLHHHIGIAAGTIENYVKHMAHRIKKGQPINEAMVLELLENISHQARKIGVTARFATKANFKLDAAKMNADVIEYIGEYLLNICAGVIKTLNNKDNIHFHWENKGDLKFIKKFRPLEISIVFDNMISNSRKAGSKNIYVSVENINDGELAIIYSDDGSGISDNIADKIFDLGFTTTDGSGLGLAQVKNIMKDVKGSIEFIKQGAKGAAFRFRFT